jgi:hypothetical protein
MNYEKSYELGAQVEKEVLRIIRKKYPLAHRIEGYHKAYDILVPECDVTIEVKSDQKSKYTGNILIETEFDGYPSALSVTRSDFWAIFDGYVFAWIRPHKIRKCIQDQQIPLRRFIGNGDTKYKKAHLIKKELLFQYAEKLTRKVGILNVPSDLFHQPDL